MLRPDNYQEMLRQAYDEELGHHVPSPHKPQGAYKAIFAPDGQRISMDLLQSWLRYCVDNHEHRCDGIVKYSDVANLTFIDAVNDCLVYGSSEAKYFALSYVWGKATLYEMWKTNLSLRLRKGSLNERNDKIPQTIRDAILLVRNLGERYLWVDSFCIVQDDNEHKHQAIQQMNIVYSKAFAAIVALGGNDADAGLVGIRKGSRAQQYFEAVEGVLVPTPPPLLCVLDVSVWGSQGWTFQEKLLSQRLLYFSDKCIYYQCSEAILAEYRR
jgi:hypothetical protein